MTKRVKVKKKVGAPTVFTPEMLHKLETAFSMGCSDLEACGYADIAPRSLYNYQEKHPEYLQRKEMLKEKVIFKARVAVVTGFSKDPRLALDFLKGARKEEFGHKLINEVQGEGGGPVTIQVMSSIPRPDYAAYDANKKPK